MNRKKSWVLLLLFALSLNVVHGFFTQHYHDDKHTSMHHHDSDTSFTLAYHDTCDECPCFHLNLLIASSQSKLPTLTTLKPKFEQIHTTPFSYNNTLYKPPTT